MTVPKWSNKAAVKRWAFRVIDGEEPYSPDGTTGLRLRIFSGAQIFQTLEQAAIVAAEGNNFRTMAELMTESPTFNLLQSHFQQRPSHHFNKLLADRVTDKPRKIGKPKQTEEARLANTPAAPAYVEYLAFKRLFDAAYPKEHNGERALEFAAERAEIEIDQLKNFKHKKEKEERRARAAPKATT